MPVSSGQKAWRTPRARDRCPWRCTIGGRVDGGGRRRARGRFLRRRPSCSRPWWCLACRRARRMRRAACRLSSRSGGGGAGNGCALPGHGSGGSRAGVRRRAQKERRRASGARQRLPDNSEWAQQGIRGRRPPWQAQARSAADLSPPPRMRWACPASRALLRLRPPLPRAAPWRDTSSRPVLRPRAALPRSAPGRAECAPGRAPLVRYPPHSSCAPLAPVAVVDRRTCMPH